MPTDIAPVAERRLSPALLAAHGLSGSTPERAIDDIVQSWAPFRTWAGVLVRSVA